MASPDEVLEVVQTLLESVKRLEALYPGRSFTLDGHLVGSIGEVLASKIYGLKLLTASAQCHDARSPDGRNVQVKLTQINRIAMYSEPDYLLVLGLNKKDGTLHEIYNGPGAKAWSAAGKLQKNGQRTVAVSRLRNLNGEVHDTNRIAQVRAADWFSVD